MATIYQQTVLNDNPSAYYRMNETTGTTVFDFSRYAYNGTTSGSPTQNVATLLTDRPDQLDKCYTFVAASSQYVTLPNAVVPTGSGPWSLECWCNLTSLPTTGNFFSLITLGNDATYQTASLKAYYDGTNGYLLLSVYNGYVFSAPITTGTTYHLVGTYNGKNLQFFVNGVAVTLSPSVVLNIVASFSLLGAAGLTPREFYNGKLDEVAIYGYALSPQQVQAHFLIGSKLLPAGGCALFANGTGTASFDHFRWTQYPDPSLSLAPITGRLGSSFVQWNDTLPTGAQVGVDVSNDGVSWTDISAGSAMSFDGSSGYITLPTTGLPTGAASWTLEAWVTIPLLLTTTAAILAMGNRAASQLAGLYIIPGSGAAYPSLGLFGPDLTSTTSLTPGSTYHLLGSYDGTNARLYVNGVLTVGPSAVSRNLVQSFASIGADGTSVGNYFQGTIDECAIFSTALSAQKVLNHYNAGLASAGSGTYATTVLVDSPIRYYHLDDLTTTVIDSGSQAHNGTASGGVTYNATGLISSWSGSLLPTLTNQSQPTVDGFSTNSSANYVSTARTGGTAGTWTYDTTNSRLVATSGTNAIYYSTLVSTSDMDCFGDFDRSDAGGLVWRFVDASNFYYLLIGDALASSGTKNQVTLYRVASNTQTQLATAAASYTYGSGTGQTSTTFIRGSYHRFRVTMFSSTITVYMDGIQLLSYIDASPIAGPGFVGLFNNGGTTGSRYYQIWIQPQGAVVTGSPVGDIVTSTFLYTRARLSTALATALPQLTTLVSGAVGPNIQLGALIPSANYQNTFVSKNLDDLAKQSNYIWYIDQNKVPWFLGRQASPSPWLLTSNTLGITSDLEFDSNLRVEVSNDLYRNRQTITGVVGTASFTNSFPGDGTTTSFTLSYPIQAGTIPVITRNGLAQTVGAKGTTGSQWYYTSGSTSLAQDSSQTALVTNEILTVVSIGVYPTTVTVDSTSAQSALAAVEGGSGIVEDVVDMSNVSITLAAAQTYAQQLITRYGVLGRTFTFGTYRNGLAIGQILTVFLPEQNLSDVQLLITAITVSLQTLPGNLVLYYYLVTGTELPNIGSWQKLLAQPYFLNG